MMRLSTQCHHSAGKAMAMALLCYGSRMTKTWGHFWMKTIAMQWQQCSSSFWGERVVPCCQKQQTASNNEPVAAAALGWPIGNSVRATAQIESSCNGITNRSITLLWQWHYYAMATALLCHGMGVTLLWQWYCSAMAMAVCCKGQQQLKFNENYWVMAVLQQLLLCTKQWHELHLKTLSSNKLIDSGGGGR